MVKAYCTSYFTGKVLWYRSIGKTFLPRTICSIQYVARCSWHDIITYVCIIVSSVIVSVMTFLNMIHFTSHASFYSQWVNPNWVTVHPILVFKVIIVPPKTCSKTLNRDELNRENCFTDDEPFQTKFVTRIHMPLGEIFAETIISL